MRRVSKGRAQRLWALYVGSHGHEVEGDKKGSAGNRLANPSPLVVMLVSPRVH